MNTDAHLGNDEKANDDGAVVVRDDRMMTHKEKGFRGRDRLGDIFSYVSNLDQRDRRAELHTGTFTTPCRRPSGGCGRWATALINLRQDPWERYQDQSMMYARWWGDKLWTLIPSSAIVGQFLQTFKEYPPSQTSGTFGIEKALKMIEAGSSGGGK
jgi:hypothetical protein